MMPSAASSVNCSCLVLLPDPDRQHLAVGRVEQDRARQLPGGNDKQVDPAGSKTGDHQRQEHPAEGLPPACAARLRGLLQLVAELLHRRHGEPHARRHGGRHEGDQEDPQRPVDRDGHAKVDHQQRRAEHEARNRDGQRRYPVDEPPAPAASCERRATTRRPRAERRQSRFPPPGRRCSSALPASTPGRERTCSSPASSSRGVHGGRGVERLRRRVDEDEERQHGRDGRDTANVATASGRRQRPSSTGRGRAPLARHGAEVPPAG